MASAETSCLDLSSSPVAGCLLLSSCMSNVNRSRSQHVDFKGFSAIRSRSLVKTCIGLHECFRCNDRMLSSFQPEETDLHLHLHDQIVMRMYVRCHQVAMSSPHNLNAGTGLYTGATGYFQQFTQTGNSSRTANSPLNA